MNTLTMALAAALLAGNAPEKVSGEAREVLDMSGEWEGILIASGGMVFEGTMTGWAFTYMANRPPILITTHRTITELGGGKFVLRGDLSRPPIFGIYKGDANHLWICLYRPGDQRPTEFRAGEGRALIVLRRPRPRK